MSGMWQLILNGGLVSMLFILITGSVALATAFHYAIRARARTYDFIKWMVVATLFGTLAATCGDVAATLYHVAPTIEKEGPQAGAAMLAEGFAESTSPGILGFAFLGLTSMLVAIGRRRRALDEV